MTQGPLRVTVHALIYRKQLVFDAAKNHRMEPRTKINLAPNDGRQFFTVTEVLEANAFQHAGLKFGEHVHVAVLRVEVVMQDGTEQTQFADAALSAEMRNLVAVYLNGQFGNTHAEIVAEMKESGNCRNCAEIVDEHGVDTGVTGAKEDEQYGTIVSTEKAIIIIVSSQWRQT